MSLLGFVLLSFPLKGGILIVTTPWPQGQAAVYAPFPGGRDKRGSTSCCYDTRERFQESIMFARLKLTQTLNKIFL